MSYGAKTNARWGWGEINLGLKVELKMCAIMKVEKIQALNDRLINGRLEVLDLAQRVLQSPSSYAKNFELMSVANHHQATFKEMDYPSAFRTDSTREFCVC